MVYEYAEGMEQDRQGNIYGEDCQGGQSNDTSQTASHPDQSLQTSFILGRYVRIS